MDMFLSNKKLTELFKSEEKLLYLLQNSIEQYETHVALLERQFNKMSTPISRRGPKEQYLSNPLHVLALVRRLTADWVVLNSLIGYPSRLFVGEDTWASEKDLRVVVRSLVRLQLTYNLSTKDLANGIIDGIPTNATITAADCVILAHYYYERYLVNLASEWLDQALSKNDASISTETIMELTVLYKCFSGDSVASASSLSSLLKEFPGHEPSQLLLNEWQLIVSGDCTSVYKEITKKMAKEATMPKYPTERYNWLCQGGGNVQMGLKCYYTHYNKSHLKLGPFRLEELQLDPPLILFHDVVFDKEVVAIKKEALKWLDVSKTYSPEGKSHLTPYRTSEGSWIYNGESKVLDNLSKRMADMTNLDTLYAEAHQVARYGLGAEYLFHTDYFSQIPTHQKGNRIATLLFYLSDVPRGGHTAFYNWKLSVKPQKGSAILWFNLHRNGTPDTTTWHAGCSVLEGTKWVLNRWFHELNNDFTTACLPDPEGSFKYFYI